MARTPSCGRGERETWKPSLVGGKWRCPQKEQYEVWLVHHDVLLPFRESAVGKASDLWALLQGIKETAGQSQTAISSFIPQEQVRPEAHNLRGGTFQVFNGLQRALAGSSGHQGGLLVADPRSRRTPESRSATAKGVGGVRTATFTSCILLSKSYCYPHLLVATFLERLFRSSCSSSARTLLTSPHYAAFPALISPLVYFQLA